jgi:hypothetical protein
MTEKSAVTPSRKFEKTQKRAKWVWPILPPTSPAPIM